MASLRRMIRRAVRSKALFEFWQRLGLNVTHKHFYSPIPDTRELAKKSEHWSQEQPLHGVEMNVPTQLDFLETIFPEHASELNFPVEKTEDPSTFCYNNSAYGYIDASVLHLMVRHFKPSLMLEVGSGNSTLVSARASLMNKAEGHACRLVSIEPYPKKILTDGFAGLNQQIPKKVQEVDWEAFERLGPNDILFIDSSHVVKAASDVIYLFLEILPRLKRGVVVHVHDIFFPYDYPRQWVVDRRWFWNEQYLLQAFLAMNPSYKVLFGTYFMKSRYPEKMDAFFKEPEGYHRRLQNSSFWMQKIL